MPGLRISLEAWSDRAVVQLERRHLALFDDDDDRLGGHPLDAGWDHSPSSGSQELPPGSRNTPTMAPQSPGPQRSCFGGPINWIISTHRVSGSAAFPTLRRPSPSRRPRTRRHLRTYTPREAGRSREREARASRSKSPTAEGGGQGRCAGGLGDVPGRPSGSLRRLRGWRCVGSQTSIDGLSSVRRT